MWQRSSGPIGSLLGSSCANVQVGGYSDWRLPSVVELATIVDFAVRAPAINTQLFPEATNGFFRTSTPIIPGGSLNFWTIDFSTGRTVNGSSVDGYVRCVRRDVERLCFTAPRFVTDDKASGSNGVATIVDKKTTLAWQRDVAPQPLAWEDAKRYCAAFGRAAHLPTAKEFLSIVDWNSPTAVDVVTFPDTPAGEYWTSTAVAGSRADGVTMSLGNALANRLGASPTGERKGVRCIVNP